MQAVPFTVILYYSGQTDLESVNQTQEERTSLLFKVNQSFTDSASGQTCALHTEGSMPYLPSEKVLRPVTSPPETSENCCWTEQADQQADISYMLETFLF